MVIFNFARSFRIKTFKKRSSLNLFSILEIYPHRKYALVPRKRTFSKCQPEIFFDDGDVPVFLFSNNEILHWTFFIINFVSKYSIFIHFVILHNIVHPIIIQFTVIEVSYKLYCITKYHTHSRLLLMQCYLYGT